MLLEIKSFLTNRTVLNDEPKQKIWTDGHLKCDAEETSKPLVTKTSYATVANYIYRFLPIFC